MDAETTNAVLQAAKSKIDFLIQNDVREKFNRWGAAVDTTNAEMATVAKAVVHATVIPLLFIAIDHHWPADDNEWPDWTIICTADSTTLLLHPWWPCVEGKGIKTKQGESSTSVLGKRKATEDAEAESRRDKDLGKAQVEEEAEAEGAGKADGQMKTSDDANKDMVIEDEEEAAWRKEKVAGKMKAAGEAEAEGAGKAVGEMKTSEDANEDMVIEDEEEATRRKEKVAGKMKAAGDSVGNDIERGRPTSANH